MDIGFIQRTLKTTGILALIVLAFGWMYYPFYDVLALFTGMIWSMVNFYFLALLIMTTIRPGEIDKGGAIVLGLVKLPLLYTAGYFLVKAPIFDVVPLAIGFSSLFAVMLLKVLARVMLGLDDKRLPKGTKEQEAH
jgi:hypothetical protein